MKIAHFLFLFLSVLDFWWNFLCCICTFRFVKSFSGKLLFCAIDCINFYSVCCFSFVSGNETILVIWY